MKTKKRMLAVLAIFFMLITSSAAAVVLQSIKEAFPEASTSSVYLILSLPTVFTMFASVLSGQLTAKKVKYKTMAVAGLSIATVTGVFPFFLNSVPAILVSRAIFGIGIGLMAACSLAAVVATVYTSVAGNMNGLDPVRGVFLLSAVGCVILAAVWGITHLHK